MNGAGKSDRPPAWRPPCGVPGKPANKDGSCRRRRGYGEPYTGTQAETPDTAKGAPTATPAGSPRAAERAEERDLAKGNPRQQNAPRTPRRQYGVHSALERIRQAARRDRTLRFTALMHHVDNPAMLREAYFSLKREAAPGVDRVTWRQYGRDLEGNLLNGRQRRRWVLRAVSRGRGSGAVAVAWKDVGGQYAGSAMDRAGATDSYGGGEGDGVRGVAYGALSPSG